MTTRAVVGNTGMIYLLPGMGADHRMYGPEWDSLARTKFLGWPPYRGETTFGEVADRVIAEHGITPRDVVGGSSLGGMIALEVSHRLRNARVVLIGSAVAPTEINGLLRRLAPLATVTPLRLIQALAGRSASTLTSMFADADHDFVRAMCLALPDWPGYTGPQDRLVRIHGANDRVIACPPACHAIPRAGHLLAMTHPEECVSIVRAEVVNQAFEPTAEEGIRSIGTPLTRCP